MAWEIDNSSLPITAENTDESAAIEGDDVSGSEVENPEMDIVLPESIAFVGIVGYVVILYYTYNEVSITTEMPQPHRKVF